MRTHRPASFAMVGLLLAACTAATATPSSRPPAATAPTPAASPGSVSPTPAVPSGPSAPTAPSASSADPVPSEELVEFSCELPVVEDATVATAHITDVRVGTHAGHDRVVFEFADGLPEVTLDRATPPFTHDASGMPVEVEGSSFLRLTMRGGTKQTADGTSSYDGPTDLDPGFRTLLDLVEGGDFEAQSTWYLGLQRDACARVLLLTGDGAPRLVVDLEH